MQRASRSPLSPDAVAALVAAILVLLTVLGNALAMFVASAVGLVIGLLLVRGRAARPGVLAIIAGSVAALVVAVLQWLR